MKYFAMCWNEHGEAMSSRIDVIGRTTHTGLDEAFYMQGTAFAPAALRPSSVPVVLGWGSARLSDQTLRHGSCSPTIPGDSNVR